ncbi:MAG: ABC transporter permease subunit [Actinomycetes bacterium]
MTRAAAAALGLVVVLLTLVLGSTTATAATAAPTDTATTAGTGDGAAAGGELIRVRVRTEDGEDVPGVDVTVEQGGQEVGSATTDDSGVAEIPVPEAGEYSVALDEETLSGPAEGLTPRQNPVETTVNAGSPRTVAFRLGEGGAVAAGGGINLDRVAQLAASGLRFGLIIALAAIGLSLIFGTTGLTNFAHGELVTFGALTAYFLNAVLGVQLILATLVTLVAAGLFGYLNDRGLWGPLRKRGTGLIAMMIVSIGLAIFLRYFFLYLAGGETKSYTDYRGQAGVSLGPVTLRPIDWISMALAVVVLVAVGMALLRTRLGKATRAVADNPALAAASGIDVDRVIRTVWIGGAALAALSGVLLGLAQQVSFQMGLQILLLVFAAVVLGGLGTAFGALAGAVVVGLFIELSTLVVPTELKNVGALAVLILVLLFRPQGILGRAERVG